jgi:DNA-binding Lrp family transcriptional regulator
MEVGIMTRAAASRNPQSRTTPALDGTDLAILAELASDGRLTNAALASRVGVAESTCIHRVRALREAGVISGFHATLDLAAIGLPLQAVIKVRLGSHNRDHVHSFHATLTNIPGMLTAFHIAGADDYLLHVAVESPEALRDLVLEHITIHPAVRNTETHLVFEVITGAGALPAPTRRGSRRT